MIPLDVEVTYIVEWSLKMLSDFIQGNIDFGSRKFDTSLMTSSIRSIMNTNDQIIENFCAIPNILKTVLLIEEDVIRHRILQMPILQRSLLHTILIDEWLILLLMSNTRYERGIEYFEIISSLKITKGLDLSSNRRRNAEEFNLMIRKIARLDGIVKSL